MKKSVFKSIFESRGCHRVRVKLSCLVLQVLTRDSREILELGETCNMYFYDFVRCDIMIYLGGIYDVFQI